MRAVSMHPDIAWALLRGGLRRAPVSASGPLLLHTAARATLTADERAAIARLAPSGPRPLPRGSLVGIAHLDGHDVIAAWPLPAVRHLGSAAPFAVDPAALSEHQAAYVAAWRAVESDAAARLCRFCGAPCSASCLLSRPAS